MESRAIVSATESEKSRLKEQLRSLAKRNADRKPDLADLCLIRMSELYPHYAVKLTI
jgi:hypothetical protein